MGNYPIINPNPIDQANPLVCSFAGHGATASHIDVCAADLAKILNPLGALLGYEDIVNGHLTYQFIDGLVHCYNFDGTLTAIERAALRLDLQSALYGNADDTAAPAICSVGNAQTMPGYTEENSWCCFVTSDPGGDPCTNAGSGLYASTAGFYAWQLQVWSLIWGDHIRAGLIPPGASWTVVANGEPSFPWGYVLGYGLDPVDDATAANTAADSMLIQLQGWMGNAGRGLC